MSEIVRVDQLEAVEFDQKPLLLGPKVYPEGHPMYDQENYLVLDKDDLAILAKVLRIRMPGIGSITSSSPGLELLAQWAAACASWMEKRP